MSSAFDELQQIDYQIRVAEWLKEQPPAVREKATQYPAWQDYVLKTTGLRAHIYSYDVASDGSCETCTIITYNRGLQQFVRVFGTLFSDLRAVS